MVDGARPCAWGAVSVCPSVLPVGAQQRERPQCWAFSRAFGVYLPMRNAARQPRPCPILRFRRPQKDKKRKRDGSDDEDEPAPAPASEEPKKKKKKEKKGE